MEVMHRPVEEEEQQLLPRRRQLPDPKGYVSSSDDSSSDAQKEEEVDQNGSSPRSVYLDKNEDTTIQWSVSGEDLKTEDEVNISRLVNAVINRQSIIGDMKAEILSVSSVKTEEESRSKGVGSVENVRTNVVEEESDEEEIELEFERAVDKLHTHTPFCPNCNNRITKVILRRKKRSSPLFGCLRCFSVFVPSGDCLNPFRFFKSKPDMQSSSDIGYTSIADAASKPELEKPNKPSTDTGKHSLNPFNCFGHKPKVEYEQPSTGLENDPTIKVDGMLSTHGKREDFEKGESSKLGGEAKPKHPTSHFTIDIEEKTDTKVVIDRGDINLGVPEQGQSLISGNQRSKSLEILKCIVHGGLLESIASLSVVSSAAASDATTLNVVTIGMATLFSGLIAFGYSLIDLRNEEGSIEKYEEALGKKGHFAFHSTFAILSYLVFGLVAPTTYEFAFHESDNKDYKIIAVAVAGFACVYFLATAKAYVSGADTFGGYAKTIMYYLTMAVSVSGVAYAAGDGVGILLDKFDSARGLTPPIPAWVSY